MERVRLIATNANLMVTIALPTVVFKDERCGRISLYLDETRRPESFLLNFDASLPRLLENGEVGYYDREQGTTTTLGKY